MTNLRETIDHYHSLLDPETARETHEQLTEQLLRRGLFFGDRPLSTVLRPRFIHPDQYRALQVAIQAVMPAFQKIHHAAMADAGFRAKFRLNEWEEEIVQDDPGFDTPSPTSRMDTFFDEEESLYLMSRHHRGHGSQQKAVDHGKRHRDARDGERQRHDGADEQRPVSQAAARDEPELRRPLGMHGTRTSAPCGRMSIP